MTNKIFLVAKREYLTRVRKKSFIVMTILAPLLVVFFYGLIIYLSINREIGNSAKNIYVTDESGIFKGKLKNSPSLTFTFGEPAIDQKKLLDEDGYAAILQVKPAAENEQQRATLIYTEQPGLTTVGYIEGQLTGIIKDRELSKYGINSTTLDQINKNKVHLSSVKYTDEGLKSGNAGATTMIGFVAAIAIYLFIFLYGVQVMQGVIEEKTNRIVEVIISSVKPFQLMMGKITGIAMVGLTQFVIWGILVVILGGSVSGIIMQQIHLPAAEMASQANAPGELGEIMGALANFNYPLILGMFLFYFIAGYLFYGALFAAIGSAVDNETDKQQFMMPVTLPLVFAFAMAQTIIVSNPNGSMAFWLSIVPFTSPVVMMVRIPFGVPAWEIILSVCCMIAGFIGTVWLAGRIYRVGILMYGKKTSWKELGKWIFYKG